MNIGDLFTRVKALGFLLKKRADQLYTPAVPIDIAGAGLWIMERSVSTGDWTTRQVTTNVTPSTIVQRDTNSRISAASGIVGSHVVTLTQLDGRLTLNQRTAINALDPATSTVADIINALKAP